MVAKTETNIHLPLPGKDGKSSNNTYLHAWPNGTLTSVVSCLLPGKITTIPIAPCLVVFVSSVCVCVCVGDDCVCKFHISISKVYNFIVIFKLFVARLCSASHPGASVWVRCRLFCCNGRRTCRFPKLVDYGYHGEYRFAAW